MGGGGGIPSLWMSPSDVAAGLASGLAAAGADSACAQSMVAAGTAVFLKRCVLRKCRKSDETAAKYLSA